MQTSKPKLRYRTPGSDDAPARIVVVDPDLEARQELASTLGVCFDIVAEADSPVEGIAAVERHQPDVVLVALDLGSSANGIALTGWIMSQFPGQAVIVRSDRRETLFAERALDVGARGFLWSGRRPVELISELQRVSTGGLALEPSIREFLLLDGLERSLDGLSQTERDLLYAIAGGATVAVAVARAVDRPVDKVERELWALRVRMAFTSWAQLVLWTHENLRPH